MHQHTGTMCVPIQQHPSETACCPAPQLREIEVTVPRSVQRVESIPTTVMVPRQIEEPEMEIQRETIQVPKTVMVEEVVERQVPKMVERTIEETVMVPQVVEETVMVPQTVQRTIMVPKVQQRTVMERAMTTRTVMEPQTVMQDRCVEDQFEETRVIRVDPASGRVVDDGHAQNPYHQMGMGTNPRAQIF